MKLGSKSNLVSAYSALFTVAFGVLIYDYARRSSGAEERPVATLQEEAGRKVQDLPAPVLAAR